MIRKLFDFIGAVLGFLFIAGVWFLILSAVNSLFSDYPIWWTFIEMGAYGIIFLIAHLNERYRDSLCHHKNKRTDCVQCKKEEQERDKERLLNEIKMNAQRLYDEESSRMKSLNKQRASYLLELSPNDFEDSVATLFSKLGYEVIQTPYVNDGGKDAIAYKDDIKYLIECKRHARENTIGRPMLQKLHAAMIDEDSEHGIFVTTSYFTSPAYEYGRKYNMELIDGDALGELYRKEFPLAESDSTFRQMCYDCGDILTFDIHSNETKQKCINGHIVERKIPILIYNNFSKTYRAKRKKLYRY